MGNELMWLVYGVNLLDTFAVFCFIAFVILLVGCFLKAMAFFVNNNIEGNGWSESDIEKGIDVKFNKTANKVFGWGLALWIFTLTAPDKDTAIMMAGAYLIQEAVTSEEAKEIGDLASAAVKSQLRSWGEEVPELKDMLIESGIQEAKKVVDNESQVVENTQ